MCLVCMNEKLENLSNKGDEYPADKYLYGMYIVLILVTIFLVLTLVGVANADEDYNLSTLTPKVSGSNNNDLPVRVKNAVAKDHLIVPRAVKMFSFAASTSNAVYASVCGISTLAALGLVVPAGALASITACAVGLGVLVLVNWVSFIVSSHNDNGGWE